MADRQEEQKEEEVPLGAPPPPDQDLPDVPPPPYPGSVGDVQQWDPAGYPPDGLPPYPGVPQGTEGLPPYPTAQQDEQQGIPMPHFPKLDSSAAVYYYPSGHQYPPPPGYAGQYPPPPGPYPGYQTPVNPRYHGQQGAVIISTQPLSGSFVGQRPLVTEPKPETHLLLSIFTCLCCSPIFGLIAICFSLAADSAYAVGDVVGARRNARTALIICVVGIVLTFMLFGVQLMLRMSTVHHH